MATAKEIKDFGASIKNLPPEQRKAAGIKFKEMQALVVAPVETLKVDKKGKELWSHRRGHRDEIVGYENCISMQHHVIWGNNLKLVIRSH